MSQTNKKQALGKGIRALLSNIDEDLNTPAAGVPAATGQNAVNTNAIARIATNLIDVNPKQPRHDFDEQALKELSESIKLHDIIQPITVIKTADGRYQLISGERRLRASKMAGLTDIPAYIRTADGQELLEMALLENLQRENLNAIEIALSYKRLMEECDLTQEQVSERMKKERSTVTNYLRLLKLPPDIQKSVRDGQISMGHARAITGLEHVDQQLYVYRETIQRGLSVRQVEQLVKEMGIEKAPRS
ncbi:MAG: ParB/RepB/Spo0J family partition protein, partial [Chitinophagia bacterium]|nr:ParB/RepB/Spo0J family partition protein [Chitinophagia bacterium]